MIASPMKELCGPKLRDAAGYSAEFEFDVRSFSNDFLGHEKEKLQHVIADVVLFLKQKQLITPQEEEQLTHARKVRNKIQHKDFVGAKEELEKAGYTIPALNITGFDLSSAKSGEDILAILIGGINGTIVGEKAGLSSSNSSDYANMWDSSIKGGCFDLSVDLFTKASSVISNARMSLI